MPTVYQYETENLAIGDVYGGHDSNRYYLHEYFESVPADNQILLSSTQTNEANLQAIIPLLPYTQANKNFEIDISGTSTASYNTTGAGINLTTQNVDTSSITVLPHLATTASPWQQILWNTASQVHWSCSLKIDSNSNIIFWAGLKLTKTETLATDADQAYFTYDPNGRSGNALTSTANLHFVYSVDETDYITDLGLAIAADTVYKLRIEIDSNRQIQVYVNDTLYGLATTSDATGTTAAHTLVKSLALKDNINLIPYVGVETCAAAVKILALHYEHISKVIS